MMEMLYSESNELREMEGAQQKYGQPVSCAESAERIFEVDQCGESCERHTIVTALF